MISLFPNPDPSVLKFLDANFNVPLPFKWLNISVDSDVSRHRILCFYI